MTNFFSIARAIVVARLSLLGSPFLGGLSAGAMAWIDHYVGFSLEFVGP